MLQANWAGIVHRRKYRSGIILHTGLPARDHYLQGLMWVLDAVERKNLDKEHSFPKLPDYQYPLTIEKAKEIFLGQKFLVFGYGFQ